ncbi:tetratricopeptide repeat protein [Snodgrassella alvi]|uniref:tetratricopeptide repeat protein n=1 Tax=Snodgrassella alvi TaxID=1196083 RepID=UPI00351AA6B3
MADDKVNKQIEELSKISRDDGKEEYAKAQFKLGSIYVDIKQVYEEAIRFYSNVTKVDAPEPYAKAQFNLSLIYKGIKQDYDKAVQFFSNITRDDAPELYANAQFNLGLIYKGIKQDYDKAVQLFSNITRDDAPKLYAFAQFNLGLIYKGIKQDYDKAVQFFSNITRDDAPELYAFAQFNIGIFYLEKKQDYDMAVQFFSNITRDDAPELYAFAQFNIGSIYFLKNQDYDKAVRFYSNITRDVAPELYAFVQSKVMFELGNIYLFKKNRLNKFPQYYKKTKYSSFCPDYFIAAQLILELNNLESWGIDKIKKLAELVIDHIKNICNLAKEIKDSLTVSFDKKSLSNETPVSKNPERRVAHYTRPGVLFNLLKGENPSKFRLNIVDFMNDPSENQVLTQWLNISNNQDNEIKTFLASFSFNHNSLNQFRLYGNEDNIHGSGVSIAFSQDFFGQDADRSINSENINISKNLFASLSKNEKLISYPFKSQNNEISNQLKTENEANTSLHPLSLYRCLYFDPKTEYMSLAKRNKQSFYLEMYNENNDTKLIDEEWQNYINDFKEEEQIKTIRVKMNKIKSFIGDLLKHDDLNKISNLEQLISLAVLPISCLIKHAAFEDEDECRMIYITNIADDKIVEPTNYQDIDSLYVEYTHVENYIDNIYLGPQCKMQHKLWLQNHFKKKHNGKEIKLIKSEMPLR